MSITKGSNYKKCTSDKYLIFQTNYAKIVIFEHKTQNIMKVQ